MIFEEKNALAFHSSAPWKFERPLSAQYKTHISRRPRCSARKRFGAQRIEKRKNEIEELQTGHLCYVTLMLHESKGWVVKVGAYEKHSESCVQRVCVRTIFVRGNVIQLLHFLEQNSQIMFCFRMYFHVLEHCFLF